MISLLEWQNRVSWKFLPFFFDCTSQMNNLILVKISPKWPLSITVALCQLQRNAQEINPEARRHLARWANNGKKILLESQWLPEMMFVQTSQLQKLTKDYLSPAGVQWTSVLGQTKPTKAVLKDTKTRQEDPNKMLKRWYRSKSTQRIWSGKNFLTC